jgi:hypothetical protein
MAEWSSPEHAEEVLRELIDEHFPAVVTAIAAAEGEKP